MNRLLIFLSILLVSCSSPKLKEDQFAILPKPKVVKFTNGFFAIKSDTKIVSTAKNQQKAVKYLQGLFASAAGFSLESQDKVRENCIQFKHIDGLASEAYKLELSSKGIVIAASDEAGYFYAVQTLRQLLPPAIESKHLVKTDWLLPCVSIEDEPRFAWRGMQMDFSRHFFDIDEVKTFLDYMALYKLNTYHMHLTDDQGWRVEIKQFPLLTEKGAWRTENKQDKVCIEKAKTDSSFTIDPNKYQLRDGKKMYGGFFTQAQIKEIIKYADDRCIRVIPEIDMPGHFKAAIDNYPFLSCKGEAGWGKTFTTPACLGKQTTYNFAERVLEEIADLFPSEYIHIGGDEVNKKSWEECANCQKEISKNKLNDEHELQSHFNRHIEKFLQSKGKKLLGWDEITTGGVSEKATVMWWRNWAPKALSRAANNGNKIIITPSFNYYFDYTNEATNTQKVYDYQSIPENFTEEQAKLVMGIQANLWSEWIPNFERLQYQSFPRILALSETAWTEKESKNFEEFNAKVRLHLNRLDVMNINYYLPFVEGLGKKIVFIDSVLVPLQVPMNDLAIHYTIDGTTPSTKSTLYKKPILVKQNCEIIACAFKGNKRSKLVNAKVEKQDYRKSLAVNPTKGKIKQWIVTDFANEVQKIELKEDKDYKLRSEINADGYQGQEDILLAFKGYFYAKEDAIYEFFNKSDGGSLLYVGDELLVDNTGEHGVQEKSSMIALQKGYHPLSVYYQQARDKSILEVSYATSEKMKLAEDVLAY